MQNPDFSCWEAKRISFLVWRSFLRDMYIPPCTFFWNAVHSIWNDSSGCRDEEICILMSETLNEDEN